MRSRNFFIIGLIMISVGTILGFSSFMQYFSSQGTASSIGFLSSKDVVNNAEVPVKSGIADRIEIKSLDIDLPVVRGYYNQQDKSWTLSKDKVQYAVSTPKNNNKHGNTFLYGHNNKTVFASLYKLKKGDRVVIHTKNNKKFIYEFIDSYETDPYDSSVFEYKGPPILTIQTCSGLWYQNRQLFSFNFVRTE